jgi:predicted nicotinamide N-methyase
MNIAPPFWAFAWPGAEALALHISAHPNLVAQRKVLDFAAGCGLSAIAAARAGAITSAAEIDPLARAAIRLNAATNNVTVDVLEDDVTGAECRWDVILAGDVFYEAPMTNHILPWLRNCAKTATVIIADPGRAYTPTTGLEPLATYTIPTSLALEDRTQRTVRVARLLK